MQNIVTKQRYFAATGALVDAALARVLEDVLALPDITEDESHRLSELCRVMNALEGLFIDADDPEQPSRVVAHVPSWLKFSYLSELLVGVVFIPKNYRRLTSSRKLPLRMSITFSTKVHWWTLSGTNLYGWFGHCSLNHPRERHLWRGYRALPSTTGAHNYLHISISSSVRLQPVCAITGSSSKHSLNSRTASASVNNRTSHFLNKNPVAS